MPARLAILPPGNQSLIRAAVFPGAPCEQLRSDANMSRGSFPKTFCAAGAFFRFCAHSPAPGFPESHAVITCCLKSIE
jgi:hypothetical protein